MKKFRIILLIGLAPVISFFLKCGTPAVQPSADSTHQKFAYEKKDFPDFGAMISVDTFLKKYPGHKIFKLSQDYPETLPGADSLPSFFKLPFDDKAKWMEWLLAARDYCFDG